MYMKHVSRGFTLIEMMVAVALFVVVMMVTVGALLSILDANQKAQATQSVINNLNIALDGMVRTIRAGTNYRCGSTGGNCATTDDFPGDSFEFTKYGGTVGNDADDIEYSLGVDNRLYRKEGTLDAVAITAAEVVIDDLEFYVQGAGSIPVDQQPRVLIIVRGTVAPGSGSRESTFHIQAFATQREIDYPIN